MRQKQDNTKDVREEQEHLSDFMGDIGNFDLPDLDLNLVDFLPSDETEETRYTLPKVVPMKEDFVMYDNAQKMARSCAWDSGNASMHSLAVPSYSGTSSRRT